MTVYVILHYLAEKSTITCIGRIKELDGNDPIIVVDNASPNESGNRLKEIYQNDDQVMILSNDENAGFARGNNIGVVYACKYFRPDFVVVLNDDVEILQTDFSRRIEKSYAKRPFDLMGPDIISQYSGVHQNPKYLEGITLEKVRRKIAYVRRSQNPILMYLSSREKSSDLLYRQVMRRRRKKTGIDSSRASENVVLHGSCLILSRRFLRMRPEPFYSETFMYYEMEILDWLCRREGFVSCYDPELKVLHHQNVATSMQYQSIISRSKFVAKCLLDSLYAAERLITESDG